MEQVRELAEMLVRFLVDFPDDVRVESVGPQGRLVEIHVHPSDVGKVVGKQGHTATAIRVLINNAAARYGIRVTVEIVDPKRPYQVLPPRFRYGSQTVPN